LSNMVSIRPPVGGKSKIDIDTYHAIKRAALVMADDRRVAAYAAGPHEGITPELVAHIRKRMAIRGEITERTYSRQMEAIHDANAALSSARG